MRVAAAVALSLLAFAAAAADRSYAVLALVGDQLTISIYQPATGSRLDRNVRQVVPLQNDALDRALVQSIGAEIERLEPGANVELLAAGNHKVFEEANASLDGGGVASLVPTIRSQVGSVKATHWLVVTKQRAEVGAETTDGQRLGSGSADGLGFYIDRTRSMMLTSTGEAAQGYLAPFAYLRLTLIEAATGKIVAETKAIRSRAIVRPDATHPWDALEPDEKVRMIQELAREGVEDELPKLLGKR